MPTVYKIRSVKTNLYWEGHNTNRFSEDRGKTWKTERLARLAVDNCKIRNKITGLYVLPDNLQNCVIVEFELTEIKIINV